MRIRAKTLLYAKGHFVAEGAEADMPQEVAERFIKAGKAEAVSGGKGSGNRLIDISETPDPLANLQPVQVTEKQEVQTQVVEKQDAEQPLPTDVTPAPVEKHETRRPRKKAE